MINLDDLTISDLEDLRKWGQEKFDHYDGFVKKVEKAIIQQRQRELGLNESSKQGETLKDKIISVLSESGEWLSNGRIRELLKKKYGLDMSATALRIHLRKGRDSYFEQKGKNIKSVWRLIRKNEVQQ